MSNSYEILNRIYDRAETRTDTLIRLEMTPMEKEAVGHLARSFNENVAYYVLNYAAQVLNGGHQQWVDNGYLKTDFEHLQTVLTAINSKHCGEVLAFINQVEIYCGPEREMPYVDDEEDFSDPFDKLDSAFYRFDKEFLDEVVAFIRAKDVETARAIFEPAKGEEGPWYVKGEDDTMHGPYDDKSDAECDADRIDGIVTTG
jgi:hypothetical protein